MEKQRWVQCIVSSSFPLINTTKKQYEVSLPDVENTIRWPLLVSELLHPDFSFLKTLQPKKTLVALTSVKSVEWLASEGVHQAEVMELLKNGYLCAVGEATSTALESWLLPLRGGTFPRIITGQERGLRGALLTAWDELESTIENTVILTSRDGQTKSILKELIAEQAVPAGHRTEVFEVYHLSEAHRDAVLENQISGWIRSGSPVTFEVRSGAVVRMLLYRLQQILSLSHPSELPVTVTFSAWEKSAFHELKKNLLHTQLVQHP